jgi:hypothetical protein
MACQKLSPTLFSAKSHAPQPDCSTPYLHFCSNVPQRQIQYAVVCECQPLMTFRSHGLPARCPVCGTSNPIKENPNDSHEE